MAEASPLGKPTKHPEQVRSYMQKGVPEQLARDVVAKDLLLKRARTNSTQLKDEKAKLEAESMVDPLTGAFNRRYFNGQLKDAFSITKRQHKDSLDTQIGVLVFDLDNFKDVNDTYGHEEGDKVLKSFVTAMKGVIREEDVFARLGGEEFGLIIRESHKLSAEELAKITERYRAVVANTVFAGGDEVKKPVTVSMGLALFANNGSVEDELALLKYADAAMYKAKEGGRNQVMKFEGLDSDGKPQFSKVEVSPNG